MVGCISQQSMLLLCTWFYTLPTSTTKVSLLFSFSTSPCSRSAVNPKSVKSSLICTVNGLCQCLCWWLSLALRLSSHSDHSAIFQPTKSGACGACVCFVWATPSCLLRALTKAANTISRQSSPVNSVPLCTVSKPTHFTLFFHSG